MRRRIASGVVVAAVVVGALLLQRQRRQEAVTLGIELGPSSATVTRLELDLVDEEQHLARRIDLRWPVGRAPAHVDRATSLRRGAYVVTARIYSGGSVRLGQERLQIADEGSYPVRLTP